MSETCVMQSVTQARKVTPFPKHSPQKRGPLSTSASQSRVKTTASASWSARTQCAIIVRRRNKARGEVRNRLETPLLGIRSATRHTLAHRRYQSLREMVMMVDVAYVVDTRNVNMTVDALRPRSARVPNSYLEVVVPIHSTLCRMEQTVDTMAYF